MQLNNGFILIHNTTATQPCDMMLFIRITRSKNINTILGSDHKHPLEKGGHTYQGKLETNTVLNFIKVLINKPFLDSPVFSPLPLATPCTPLLHVHTQPFCSHGTSYCFPLLHQHLFLVVSLLVA